MAADARRVYRVFDAHLSDGCVGILGVVRCQLLRTLCVTPRGVLLLSAAGDGLSNLFLWCLFAYVQRVHCNGWGVSRRCRRCERICATVGFPLTRRLKPPSRRRRRSLLLRISVEVDFSPSVFPSSSVCSRPPPPTRPSPLPALAPSRASFLLPSAPLRLLASLQESERQCIERCARGDLRQADITDGPVSEGHASVRACVRAGG